MATILKRGGTYSLQFMAGDGDRKTVALGTKSKRTATECKLRVDAIVSARRNGLALDPPTAAWVAGLTDELRGRLERVGLLDRLDDGDGAITVAVLLDRYFAARPEAKPSTKLNWHAAGRNLKAFFGADRDIATVTVGDARDFERWLSTGDAREIGYLDREAKAGLLPSTARKRLAIAKQFFADAVEREWLDKNPFAKLKTTSTANRSRDFFLPPDDAEKVLDACPDAEWRLLFALSRWGGLRCPSEHLSLRWSDIDWARGRFLVRSSKTAHHDGGGERWVPIFAELRPHLDAAWHALPDGADDGYVIQRYRDANANLRSQLQRIIRRAGLTPWPKLFSNLRATRATELAAAWPGHVAAAWLGHSEKVATKHYRQVVDADFEKAAGERCNFVGSNPTQPAATDADRRNKPQQEALNKRTILPTGFEHPPETREITQSAAERCNFVGSPCAEAVETDPLLVELLDRWPTLDADTREAIVRLAEGGGR